MTKILKRSFHATFFYTYYLGRGQCWCLDRPAAVPPGAGLQAEPGGARGEPRVRAGGRPDPPHHQTVQILPQGHLPLLLCPLRRHFLDSGPLPVLHC